MRWVRALLVKRCHGRLLRLFELFPNHAKIKTRKAWSDGVLLSLLYYIQTYIGFPSTVSLTKTDKKGREKKEQLVKDVIWVYKTYKSPSECSYIDTRSDIDMEIPLAIRDWSDAQQSFESHSGRVERASTRDTLFQPTPDVRPICRG